MHLRSCGLCRAAQRGPPDRVAGIGVEAGREVLPVIEATPHCKAAFVGRWWANRAGVEVLLVDDARRMPGCGWAGCRRAVCGLRVLELTICCPA